MAKVGATGKFRKCPKCGHIWEVFSPFKALEDYLKSLSVEDKTKLMKEVSSLAYSKQDKEEEQR
jgi:phage FluMu protein Com